MVDTQSRHSARELKDIIETVLDNYEIPLSNILCCITDNASNMVKLVTTMNEVCMMYEQYGACNTMYRYQY